MLYFIHLQPAGNFNHVNYYSFITDVNECIAPSFLNKIIIVIVEKYKQINSFYKIYFSSHTIIPRKKLNILLNYSKLFCPKSNIIETFSM